MAKYIIHACEERKWYIDEYLIPSMLEQGIPLDDITIYEDTEHRGCLDSCMHIFSQMTEEGGAWHLQDDVAISKMFKSMTERYDSGLVCGIATKYDNAETTGFTSPIDMWYSFPCIRIPNSIARECAEWYYKSGKYLAELRLWVSKNKYDDSVFRYFLESKYPDATVINLYPNIVQHVDYLIGGSTINHQRREIVKALHWIEPEIEEELEAKLKNSKRGG